jgi:hypothetical protein
LARPKPERKEREIRKKKKREGSVPSHGSHCGKREKKKEREKERQRLKREGKCKRVPCAKNLEKVQGTRVRGKERERWCDGGGDGVTLGGGVSTRNKRGECSPSSWRILATRVRVH